jgi:hypothetical protein
VAQEHELTTASDHLIRALDDGAEAAGARILGEAGGPDAGKVRRSAFLAYVRENWPDPQFRQELFARMAPAVPNPYANAPDGSDAEIPAKNGVSAVEDLLKDAFPAGWPEPPPPPTPLPGLPGEGFKPWPDEGTSSAPVPY